MVTDFPFYGFPEGIRARLRGALPGTGFQFSFDNVESRQGLFVAIPEIRKTENPLPRGIPESGFPEKTFFFDFSEKSGFSGPGGAGRARESPGKPGEARGMPGRGPELRGEPRRAPESSGEHRS